MISVGPGVVTSIVGNLKGGGHLIHPTVWTVQVLIEYGIFGEGSQISTNQKRGNTVSSLLIG